MENEFIFDPVAIDEAIECAKRAGANILLDSEFDNLNNELDNIKDISAISNIKSEGNTIKEDLKQVKNLPINLEIIRQEGLAAYLNETININENTSSNSSFGDSLFSEVESYLNANFDTYKELENYLSTNFDTYRELENGGYYVKADNGDEYYFSIDCIENNVHLTGYYPGMSSESNPTKGHPKSKAKLCEALEKNGVPSGSVFAISAWTKDDKYDSENCNLFDKFDAIAADLNIGVSSVQTIGFSYSGDMPLRRLNDYLEDHPDIEDCSAICIDGGFIQTIYNGKYPCTKLIEKNVPIYVVSPASTKNYNNNVRVATELSKDGFNVTLLVDNSAGKGTTNSHSASNKNVFTTELYSYLAGNTDATEKISCYDVYKYENGSATEVSNFFDNNANADNLGAIDNEPISELELPVETTSAEEEIESTKPPEIPQRRWDMENGNDINPETSLEEKTETLEPTTPTEEEIESTKPPGIPQRRWDMENGNDINLETSLEEKTETLEPTTPVEPKDSTPSKPTVPKDPEPTPPKIDILPDNKFSDILPAVLTGNISNMEIGESMVTYEIINFNESAYNDYMKSLIKDGFVLQDGIWTKGNYLLKLVFNDSNNVLTIDLKVLDTKVL